MLGHPEGLQNLRDELEQYYKAKPRVRHPLSEQKEFRVIKNVIVQEAEQLWQELEQVEGVGQNAAVLLRLIGAMGDRARRPGREEKIVASVDQAGAYFLRLLDGQRTEQLYQLCVDGKGKVLSCRVLSQGQADMTVLSLRQAVENALLSGASGVFLAHNHPSGVALPSRADVQATVQVRDA